MSLFYLETRDTDGGLNGIQIHRLKEKLGTRALPTAELTLGGAQARLIGAEGQGVKNISILFNITRIHNAINAVAMMHRALYLATDYAKKRKAFGKLLIEHPLHAGTLSELYVRYHACFHLAFFASELLGKEECGGTENDRKLLRLLTPLAKLYTAKEAIAVISECLECFGGAGYVEDTGIPKSLRDAQVLSIWEGTTNVLSLDVLRAITKEEALPIYFEDVERRIRATQADFLQEARTRLLEKLSELKSFVAEISKQEENTQYALARRFAFGLSRLMAGSLLLENAEWEKTRSSRSAIAAQHFCLGDWPSLRAGFSAGFPLSEGLD